MIRNRTEEKQFMYGSVCSSLDTNPRPKHIETNKQLARGRDDFFQFFLSANNVRRVQAGGKNNKKKVEVERLRHGMLQAPAQHRKLTRSQCSRFFGSGVPPYPAERALLSARCELHSHPLAEQVHGCGRLTQAEGPEAPIAPVVTAGKKATFLTCHPCTGGPRKSSRHRSNEKKTPTVRFR